MEDQQVQHCGICSKDIEKSKFRMHEMGCARQNYKCKTCGACVPKSEKEEHEEEEHKEVKCEHCGFKAMKHVFNAHELSCSQQPQDCKFCENKIAFYELGEHLQVCGSKTSKCPDCAEYVKNAEKELHKNEGFCDAISASKHEKAEVDSKKELEKFQQQYLHDIEKNKNKVQAPPKQKPEVVLPRKYEEIKDDEVLPQPINAPVDSSNGALDDYDQMIFNQFMGEDESELLAKQLQNEMNGNSSNGQQIGGGQFGQNQQQNNGLEIRKADSEQFGQLLGGPDENDYSNFPSIPGAQYRMPAPVDPGTGLSMARQQRVVNAPANAYAEWGQDSDNEDSVMEENNLPQMGQQNSEAEIQKAIAQSLVQAESDNVPMTEDEELARILEMSRQEAQDQNE